MKKKRDGTDLFFKAAKRAESASSSVGGGTGGEAGLGFSDAEGGVSYEGGGGMEADEDDVTVVVVVVVVESSCEGERSEAVSKRGDASLSFQPPQNPTQPQRIKTETGSKLIRTFLSSSPSPEASKTPGTSPSTTTVALHFTPYVLAISSK